MPGITCVDPGGAFYVFPSIAGLGLSSQEFALRLLQEAKVAAVPGPAFGQYGEGYLRLAYSASYDDVERGMEQMGRFVNSIAG
jgi:aminotransferase